MEITEKVAYLKGLVDGLGVDKNSNEGRIFHAILDVLDDMAYTVSDLETGVAMVSEQMDIMDDDINEIHEEVFGEEDNCCCCGHSHDDDEFDEELYEVVCPSCGDTVCIDEDMIDEGEMNCPGCGEFLEFDLDDLDLDEEK